MKKFRPKILKVLLAFEKKDSFLPKGETSVTTHPTIFECFGIISNK
jgi:hypothetical protein